MYVPIYGSERSPTFRRQRVTFRISGVALLAVLMAACQASVTPATEPAPQTTPVPASTPSPNTIPTPSSTATESPEQTAMPADTPTASPTATNEPSPTLPIVEGLAPEAVQNVLDYNGRKVSGNAKWTFGDIDLPYGLVIETEGASKHEPFYTGVLLAARAFPDRDGGIVYIGFENPGDGTHFFAPFKLSRAHVLIDTIADAVPVIGRNTGQAELIDTSDFIDSFDSTYRNHSVFWDMYDSYPGVPELAQLFQAMKLSRQGNSTVEDLKEIYPLINEWYGEGPFVGGFNLSSRPSTSFQLTDTGAHSRKVVTRGPFVKWTAPHTD